MTCHRINNAIVCIDEREYCERCGMPDDQGAKLDKRGVCQHCQFERKERTAIKRAITRESKRHVEGTTREWMRGYAAALARVRAVLDERDRKERQG